MRAIHNLVPESEILSYLKGTLPLEARLALVTRMKSDHDFASEVNAARGTLTAEEMPVSEKAADLLKKVGVHFSNAALLFPGNSYIAGIENRSDIAPEREGHLNRAIYLADQLLRLNELEDLAILNAANAAKNIELGRRAQSFFRGSTDESGFVGAVAASTGSATQTTSGACPRMIGFVRFSPLDLGDFGDSILRASRPKVSETLTEFIELAELIDNNNYIQIFPRGIQKPLKDEAKAANLVDEIRADPGLGLKFREFIDAPIEGSRSSRSASAKIVASVLLLRANKSEDVAQLSSMAFGMFDRLVDGKLGEESKRVTTCILFALLEKASKDDGAWNAIKKPLLRNLSKSRFGIEEGYGGYYDVVLSKGLLLLGSRVASDEDLKSSILRNLANNRIYKQCEGFLDAAREISPAERIKAICQFIARPELSFADKQPPGSPLWIDDLGRRALRCLSNEDVETLTTTKLDIFRRFLESEYRAFLIDEFDKRLSRHSASSGRDLELDFAIELKRIDPDVSALAVCDLLQRAVNPGDIAERYLAYCEENLEVLAKVESFRLGFIRLMGKLPDSVVSNELQDRALKIADRVGMTHAEIASLMHGEKPTQKSVLFQRRYLDSSVGIEAFRKMFLSNDVYDRIQGMRAVADENYRMFLEPSDIRLIAGRLCESSSLRMGFLAGDSSEAQQARKTLIQIASNRGDLVFSELCAMASELLSGAPSDAGSVALRGEIQSLLQELSKSNTEGGGTYRNFFANLSLAAKEALSRFLGVTTEA